MEFKNINEYNYRRATLFLIGIVLVFIVSGSLFSNTNNDSKNKGININNPSNPFEKLSLQAETVFVWDILRGEALYGRHEETQLPLASLAKVMTALLAHDSL